MTQLQGKAVLITGATDGVGRVVAKRLGEQGALVLAHGRDRQRGEAVVKTIAESGGRAIFMRADLSSLVEVRELARAIERTTDRLDILINNAGIGGGGQAGVRETSPDGYELRFAVNFLSGFLLSHLLLPLIQRSAPARIVNVSSIGQQAIDFSDVMLTRGYSGTRAYCQSKLAQIMFTFDLAEQLAGSGVTATCLHPATYMDTTMVRAAGVSPMSTVEEGADAIMHLAVSSEMEGKTGLFYDRQRPARANGQAYDLEARKQLRDLSRELVGLPIEAQTKAS